MRRLCLSVVMTLACHRATDPPPAAPAPSVAANRWVSAVEKGVASLAALDLRVATDELEVVTVTPEQAKAEIHARTDAIWPDARIRRLRALTWLFLGNAARAAPLAAIRHGVRAGALGPLVAYYAPQRIVFIDTERSRLLPRDLILTHELVHAYQDQQLEGQLFTVPVSATTLDHLGVVQLALEGHAQFVAMAAFLRARGVAESQIPPSMFEAGVDRIRSPGSALIYERGALAALAVYRARGRTGVEALWRTPPSSTEQLLHPRKLGADPPTHVPVPDVPGATLQWDDTVGEMMTRVLLSQHFLDDSPPVLAATGWDGDRLAAFETDAGALLIWRTVWDRELDARQFAETLGAVQSRAATSHVSVRGKSVDVVVVAPPATREHARSICDALPAAPRPDDSEVQRTAAVEADFAADYAARAVLRAGKLTVRDTQLRIPVPPSWSYLRIRGTHVIRAPMKDGFGDNLVISVAPNVLDHELDDVERETLRELRDVLGSTVVAHERRNVAGKNVWVVESIGHEAGSSLELHQYYFVYITATHRVVLTASALPERWGEVGPIFDTMFDGLTAAVPAR